MNNDSEIWFAFARTFALLFMVLALLLFAFYLIKRFASKKGGKHRDFIKVLSVHHLSPKEKLVLVNVLEETILIGVTPSNISKIKVMEKYLDLPSVTQNTDSGFSSLLSRTLSRSSNKTKGSADVRSNEG
ncbi:MAG: flagellar biosynthetic protein FliO [Desulfobacula sp.]|nr:flagellar biosynthetic protein FliO [Desulfobacula sp.]